MMRDGFLLITYTNVMLLMCIVNVRLSAAIPIRLSWLCFWTIREVLNNNSAEGISRNVLGCVVIQELVILNQKLSKSFKDIAISLAVISIFFQCMGR